MNTFQELELIEPVQRALAEENYETPTPIQAQTIPAALQGHDILGCAQTGTGKTAALALPILNRLGKNNRKAAPNRPIALVLAPTRELAIQIGESFETYGRHLRLRHVLVYGGVSQGNQVRALNRGAHVLVATPGRLLDLMNQGHIKLDQLETFVLDEADRMLDMGFLPDLKRIISQLPAQRQSLFFSATLAPKITELAQSLLKNPVTVNVTPKTSSVKKIKQQLMHVEYNRKQPLLQKILESDNVERALVFIRTKRTANMLAQRLMRAGFKATAIHGNKSQNARQQALEAFRSKKVQVLVATDVAARGIDIDGITHVINFDLPVEAESYVHRIGRTGRAGADGIAISFCSGNERNELRSIERLIGHKIPVSAEHRQSDVKAVEGDLEPRTRKGSPGQQRAGAKGARPERRTTRRRSASAAAAKAKPKQGQKRTKWRHLKPNAKQASSS
ncbi:DEAD/DEAH box helicase [uncultured Gimesia sp.]|uniref:DEAD/DEAH box helicase n=1 Tax=uncultured Gimesia sp. TaxID=1678688 RepID=UPI0030DBB4DC